MITIELIKLLENSGYKVCFKVFSLSFESDEIFFVNVVLKNNNERLDTFKCYYPLCCREFLRRILFRVIESQSFQNYRWGSSYGNNYSIEEIKKILDLQNNDFVIGKPSEMGIHGKDILKDTYNTLQKLQLKKYLK